MHKRLMSPSFNNASIKSNIFANTMIIFIMNDTPIIWCSFSRWCKIASLHNNTIILTVYNYSILVCLFRYDPSIWRSWKQACWTLAQTSIWKLSKWKSSCSCSERVGTDCKLQQHQVMNDITTDIQGDWINTDRVRWKRCLFKVHSPEWKLL